MEQANAAILPLVLAQASHLARNGKLDDAAAMLLHVVDDATANPQALDLIAKIYAQQGRLSDSETLWRRALGADPNNTNYQRAIERCQRPRHRTPLALFLNRTTLLSLVTLSLILVFVGLMSGYRQTGRVKDLEAEVASLSGTYSSPHDTPAPNTVLADDFSDNSLDPALWTTMIVDSGTYSQEKRQRLEINLPANTVNSQESGILGSGIRSIFQFRGDYDIQVDYQLISAPPSSGVRIGLSDGSSLVERVSFGQNGDFVDQARDVYLTDFGGIAQGITPTNDLEGTIRLVRSGNKLTAYYYSSDKWIPIFSGATTTSDVNVYLRAWSHKEFITDHDVVVAFDNFLVNRGELVFPD